MVHTMCGRYELIDGQRVLIRFGASRSVWTQEHLFRDNADVRPTQQVLVLRCADHELSLMKWGLVPSWAQDPRVGSHMINARAEGIESKPSFRRPLRSQRCIIPASAFFEWHATTPGSTGKIKYRIARKDEDLFGLAGLYDVWSNPHSGGADDGDGDGSGGEGDGHELTTCTIITTQPNEVVAPIHNRMPVILLPEDEERWLDSEMTDPGEIVSLLRPYPSELLVARPDNRELPKKG
jgi:putative SOS response-associated peptidase YedK